jgi:hypothetical protein
MIMKINSCCTNFNATCPNKKNDRKKLLWHNPRRSNGSHDVSQDSKGSLMNMQWWHRTIASSISFYRFKPVTGANRQLVLSGNVVKVIAVNMVRTDGEDRFYGLLRFTCNNKSSWHQKIVVVVDSSCKYWLHASLIDWWVALVGDLCYGRMLFLLL